MATNWDLPINITPYANVLELLRGRDDDLAKMLDPIDSATPVVPSVGWKRWNNTNRNWERFSGTAWTPLANKYNISIDGTSSNVTDIVAIANGGTGASTIAQARINLNLGALAVLSTINNSNWSGTVLSIANGGTSANTISGARSNLEVPSITGIGASGTWNIAISGNAATATTFSTNRTNYKGVTDGAVSGQLMWKNYGNNHTIFDASNGTSPSGASISQSTAQFAWMASYPTLMGWNGSETYGVRVDSARISDSCSGNAATATRATSAATADNGGVTSVNGFTGAVSLATGGPGGIAGTKITSTTNFTVPAGVTSIKVILNLQTSATNDQGHSSYFEPARMHYLTVTPGQIISAVIPARASVSNPGGYWHTITIGTISFGSVAIYSKTINFDYGSLYSISGGGSNASFTTASLGDANFIVLEW